MAAANSWRIESFDPRFPLPHEGEVILLLTKQELARLPTGTTVISIMGQEKVVGRDSIDDDTRAGYLAWGTPADALVAQAETP